MKSGVAAFTTAAIARADRLRDGPGCTLIITAGEETGCEGAFAMARAPDAAALLGRAGALVVAEPTGNAPLLGHKGAFWLTGKARGVTAHGSMPERGDNAIYKIARAALALEHFEFEEEAARTDGRTHAERRHRARRLEHQFGARRGRDRHRHSQRRGPGPCERAALPVPRAGARQSALAPRLDVASVYTEPQDPWMRRVFALCAARQGGAAPEHRTVSYFTDAAALRLPLGMPPIVILGPGEPEMAHQTDEYCRVDRIAKRTICSWA